ncbi:MAG: hypothetical protein Q8T04_16200 [Bacteroidota bacterium]|nr:hypothetical protein [Bacteroidota bacterium]
MKRDENIDDLFREKLRNYEKEPPAYLLQNVLDGAAGARRTRKIVFWRVAGVAAAILLAFVAGWQLQHLNSETSPQQIVVGPNSSPEIQTAKQFGPEGEITLDKIPETGLSRDEKSFKSATDKNLQVASQTNFQEKKITNEPILIARADESTLLYPIKTKSRIIISNNQYANVLHEMKVKDTNVDQFEMTIDQQIIEQNKQQFLAQAEKQKKVRWLVGAQVSPAFNVSESSHSQVYASNMLNSANNPVDVGGGISVEYKKGKRLSLQSGVYYSGLGQASGNSSRSLGNDYLYASAERGAEYFNTSVNIDTKSSKMMMNSAAGVIEFSSVPSGIVLGANLDEKAMVSNAVVVSDARFIQNFEYIEIPLYLRYTIIDSRFDVEMLGGFSSNVLVGNQTFMESGDGKNLVGKTQDMQLLNYSGTLGVGLKYGLSKRIFLNVEPRVKYYLNSLNNNSSVTYKPYTIGVFTGLSYEF